MAKISRLKLISIVVFFVIIFSSMIGFSVYKINKDEELWLRQKYETLNTVDISKFETMSHEELKNFGNLMYEYSKELQNNKENDEFIKNLVPRFREISSAYSECTRKKAEEEREYNIRKKEIWRYRHYLCEKEGITDESIINKKIEDFIKEYDLKAKEKAKAKTNNNLVSKKGSSIKDFIKRREEKSKQRELADEQMMLEVQKRIDDSNRQLIELHKKSILEKTKKEKELQSNKQ
ncbi:MAG: hypothetical protein II567_03935 [Candidatus Riflebacteria bacterium]|nr:hypothetical protein [Candidatus Riflebacteria bacterium]